MDPGANPDDSPWRRLPALLAFPVRANLVGLIAGLALTRLLTYWLGNGVSIRWLPTPAVDGAVASVPGFALSVLLEGLLAMFALKIAVEALLDTAHGRLGPDPSGRAWASDGHGIGQLLVWSVFAATGYVLAVLAGPAAGVLYLLAVLAVLPAAIMLQALSESFLHALHPSAWRDLVARTGTDYVAIVVLSALLALIGVGAALALPLALPGWLAAPCTRFIALYALVVAYHLYGDLLFRHHVALGIDTGPAIPRPVLANLMEDRAMNEAENLAGRGEAAAAIEVLASLMRRHGGSAPIHERYRQLLVASNDLEALGRHGREYVPALLALGQPKRALSLYLESRALDPNFQLDVPEDITRLFQHALATGQSRLAVELMADFETRFPRNADVPANLLACARLMAERLGRATEANALLEHLAFTFPDHPLAPDIQNALAEVELIRAMDAPR